MRVLIRYPLNTFHTTIEQSFNADPDAKYSPFGENYKLLTPEKWPIKALIRSLLYIFHTLIVLSSDPDAKYSVFGENATLYTYLPWP